MRTYKSSKFVDTPSNMSPESHVKPLEAKCLEFTGHMHNCDRNVVFKTHITSSNDAPANAPGSIVVKVSLYLSSLYI